MRKIFPLFLIFFFAQVSNYALAQNSNSFNLSGIIENIINYQSKGDFVSDIRYDANENFDYAVLNLHNGNVVVAYNEFQKTIDILDKNLALFMLSKQLYEYGFFSLGDVALSKISGKTKLQNQIKELQDAYKLERTLSEEEENYLAKAYAMIYYNNSPEEVAFNLVKKTNLLKTSDYANYIMAMAMFECKQYSQSLNYIEKAIDKNQTNSRYKAFKANVLIAGKKYKEAIKYIDLNENKISIFFLNDLYVLKQTALMNLAQTDSDRKFHQIYSYYLEGNYHKVLKETQNILNFSKNNPKILTLQAMANLALQKPAIAYEEFEASYKMDKKFELTSMGLADCYFIQGKYKEAYEIYKKLFDTELNKEAILKAHCAIAHLNPTDKKLVKLHKMKESFDDRAFYEYYLISNNLLRNEKEKKKYIAKSLGINFLNVNSWNALLNIDLRNSKFDNMQRGVFILSFMDNNSAEYYYFSAVCLDVMNNKKEAFYKAKKAVNINPDYKPAIDLINKLENELI